MRTLSNKPQVLQNKILLTFLAGAACCIFGIGYFIFAKDKVFLVMSIILMIACFARGLEQYLIISGGKYETLCGTCVGISSNPIKKLRSVKVMDRNGNEFTLKIGKNEKLVIGSRYKFYFKQNTQLRTGSDFLDSRLSADNFLGLELLPPEQQRKKKPVKNR